MSKRGQQHIVCADVASQTWATVRAIARANGIPVSEIVRLALDAWLERSQWQDARRETRPRTEHQ